MDDVIVGLDIGSTKVCAVIGFQNENGSAEIDGVGVAPSRGLKSGVIINIDSTVQAIVKAVEDAELMAGCEVGAVYANISGLHMKGENSKGVVAVSSRNRTITHPEIKRVIEAAQAVVIPADREIIHVLSKEFSVDDQQGIKDPLGMSGVRLEAEVHIVTGSSPSIQNITKSVARAGLQCNDVIFSPLASAEAVLSRDEKELGVALVDIGGGTSEIAVISLGGIVLGRSVRIAGDEMDEAIINYVRLKYSLLLGQPTAEAVKISVGSAISSSSQGNKEKFAVVRGRDLETGLPKSIKLTSSEVSEALAPILQEIISNIVDTLEETPPELTSDIMERGITLAGGGALIAGIDKAISEATKIPVWIADDPLTCVVRGCGVCLEDNGLLKRIRVTKGL